MPPPTNLSDLLPLSFHKSRSKFVRSSSASPCLGRLQGGVSLRDAKRQLRAVEPIPEPEAVQEPEEPEPEKPEPIFDLFFLFFCLLLIVFVTMIINLFSVFIFIKIIRD